jgi:hypothetical protein
MGEFKVELRKKFGPAGMTWLEEPKIGKVPVIRADLNASSA